MNLEMNIRSRHQATPSAVGCECLRTSCARWVIATLALACLSPAWGQPLSDPSRPPQAWLAPPSKGAGTPGAAEAERPSQLQSLLIGPSRKYAIIDGQLVGVGDTFKDARVVAVTSAGVVLSSERGKETLSLFPNVKKHSVKPAVLDAGPAPAEAKRRVRSNRISDEAAKEKK